MKKHDLPEMTEKSEEELSAIIKAVNGTDLSDGTKKFVIKCIESAIWLPSILQKKTISIKRLRDLIFGEGKRAKRKKKIAPKEDKESHEPVESTNEAIKPQIEEKSSSPKNEKKGHGRIPHTDYENCKEVLIELDRQKGDFCPMACGGKLGTYPPGILIRIKGQNFAEVTRYTVNKLRCSLCGFIVEPKLPAAIGKAKYDATFKSMLALQKYSVAVPFYRQEIFQKMLGFRLPDATQWDLIEQLAGACFAPFDALKTKAANGRLVHNDDTKIRILEVMRENKLNPERKRTGMFTTGIIAHYENQKIALFLNGTQHAGENLDTVLKKRVDKEKEILQMCDGSNQCIPKMISTILCNCLSHGFRKFRELVDYFPEECIKIMQAIGQVYTHDEATKAMSNEARLSFHQARSQPVMDALKIYMAHLLDDHIVEPNGELGKAILYMQKRWANLTRFLTVTGAPLDNNIVERALKIAIRNRKSAMFYKTRYSAKIGGMITSLIHTCLLNDANPFDYLTALQRHQSEVIKAPSKWLPWNYLKAICANLAAGLPERVAPAVA